MSNLPILIVTGYKEPLYAKNPKIDLIHGES
jgi:hypothetical protein